MGTKLPLHWSVSGVHCIRCIRVFCAEVHDEWGFDVTRIGHGLEIDSIKPHSVLTTYDNIPIGSVIREVRVSTPLKGDFGLTPLPRTQNV